MTQFEVKAFFYQCINEHLKVSAPGLKEPVCAAIARALSLKLSAKLSEQNTALTAEIDRLRAEVERLKAKIPLDL